MIIIRNLANYKCTYNLFILGWKKQQHKNKSNHKRLCG